jgi:uncharacterized protein YaaW (UPF0174 family)
MDSATDVARSVSTRCMKKETGTANENSLLALRGPVSTEILVAIAAILAIAALYYLFVRKRE